MAIAIKIGEKIIKPYQYTIDVLKTGLVAISISARCKSKEQINFNTDEDLKVEINDLRFREIPPEDNIQSFNISPAFNGSRLKGLKKTVIFLTVLNKGENIVNLIPRNGAFIEEIEVQELSDKQELELNIENQAEDGNIRPWITFVLINLPLKSLIANTSVKWRFRDSDDVKLIINNKIQKNRLSFFRKDWLWSGSILKKLFKKETQVKTIKTDLKKDLHYIEFWADRMPALHNVKFDFGEKLDFKTRAKIIWEYTNLREKPTTESDLIIEKINKYERVVILEKAIKGERFKNKGKFLKTNRWHKIEYQGKIGYIYSLALEIDGEDENSIQKLIIENSKEFNIDSEILLALSKCESEFFPYTVSYDIKNLEIEIAYGVMQISGDLLIDMDDVFDIEQNIKQGINYFNKQYNGKYKDDKDKLRKSIAAYNAGHGNIKIDKPLELELYVHETQRIVKCVQDHIKNKTFKKILDIVKKSVGILLIGFLFLTIYQGFVFHGEKLFEISFIKYNNLASAFHNNGLPKQYKDYKILKEEVVDINFGNEDDEHLEKKLIIINNNQGQGLSMGFSKMILLREDGYFIELPGWGEGFRWWQIGDFTNNHRLNIVVMYDNSGNGAYNPFYFYEWNGYNFEIKLQNNSLYNSNELIDLDDDGVLEILHTLNLGRWSWSWPEIYKWNGRQFAKVNHLFPEIYKEWLKDKHYDLNTDPCITTEGKMGDEFCTKWKEWIKQEKIEEINNCLKEKAILNSQGIFADGNNCL